MPIRCICRRDNPAVIKAWGYVGPGGLGDFDPLIYDEVVLDRLPANFEEEPPETPPQARIHSRFMALDTQTRAQNYSLKANLDAALAANDPEAAQFLIQQMALPDKSRQDFLADLGVTAV